MDQEIVYFRYGYSLLRFIFEANALHEHTFDGLAGEWRTTEDLSTAFYRGDTDLIRITEDEAREFVPAAFLD